ncbi:C-terminal processing protease CtpA/Prc, contains a PDZ domain [Pedobacter westerhofensis]|uniref:Tricorn protease homolog n=1 Tax=Pedobacter westerhofensis TaxID=425512 RepID=A0A521FM47_9SPHI|nr:S41 family peptidase [Pedobacter westerhofensis]SMO97277.1 C-terminal processing protease CtpA/Prc, contains a PDZ domain [Pedobacter westerhofensis]
MKRLIIFFAIFCVQICHAQTSPFIRWMQQPVLSPDGQFITFGYKGNIYKVSSSGGTANPMTVNNSYNGYPVWSHDGSRIAFASNRYGNFDVFVMPATGGNAERLTFDSSKDLPYDFSADDSQVYFGTDRHDFYTSVRYPNDNLWMKLYAVPVKGGRSLMINSAGTESVHFNKNGDKFLFQDRKGTEDPWRKHHRSAVTRDIWLYDIKTKSYSKVSDFEGEDREPVWGAGDNFYYLSERNGSQNLFLSSVQHPSEIKQLTNFTKDPVRNLSRAANGLIAFTQKGELYTMQEGQAPVKINIAVAADFNTGQIQNISIKDGASEMEVSPNGKEIALVVRGEIYVTAINGSGTRRITNTPYQENMVEFSPDGRSLIYAAEENGSWDIEKASLKNKNEPYFYAATTIATEPLIASVKDEFKGVYSPDGKKIAYLEDRNILKVYILEKHTAVTVLAEGNNYAYRNGDISFSWSPDSRYLLTSSSEGHAGNDNVILLSADGSGKPINLTQSGFDTEQPQWGIGGKMMYYTSNKEGLRSLSQGPGQSDIYATFFDQALFNSFQLSKNDLSLQDEMKKRDTSAVAANSKPQKKLAADSALKVNLNLNNLDIRTIKLSQNSAEIATTILSADGERLFFLAKYDNAFDLWVTALRSHDTRKLASLDAGNAGMELSKDGKSIFILADGKILKIDAESGVKTPLAFNAVMDLNADAERSYILDHAYQRMLTNFFDPKLQGVDLKYYHDEYAGFLPYINNNYDFQVLLSEFLGELNASHTGGRYAPVFPNGDETAALGLLYNVKQGGIGLKVEEVIAGGPFDLAGSKMRKGSVIDQINGVEITADADWAALLNRQKGKYTLIGFHNPETNKSYQETVKPIAARSETNLLYNRWTHLMEHLTDSLSGGKVGYVHIRQMDEANFRITIDKVKGKNRDKKALIIDSRFNPGGNLHKQLVQFFSEKTDIVARPQSHHYFQDGQPDGSAKPTCVLMSEGNYSDGFNFPYLYKRKGVGKLIGAPVAGTGTGVFWEQQIDDTMVIGFPQLGLSWIGEETLFENHQLEPDIKVINEYNYFLNGKDQQLETAVKEMLKAI